MDYKAILFKLFLLVLAHNFTTGTFYKFDTYKINSAFLK